MWRRRPRSLVVETPAEIYSTVADGSSTGRRRRRKEKEKKKKVKEKREKIEKKEELFS